MCTLLGTPPNLVIVYTALKPRHRRTLTIVIESVGCTLLGTPPNLVIVYTALKPRHRRTLTIVIESVGKIKKNTNSYLKRHLVTYTEGL